MFSLQMDHRSVNTYPFEIINNPTTSKMNFVHFTNNLQQQRSSQQQENYSSVFIPSGSTQPWSQHIPSIMPWSATCQQFTSIPPTIQPSNQPFSHQHQTIFNELSSSINSCDSASTSNPLNNTENKNNKRNFNYLINDINEYEFDFDNHRPIKKYICEDKVLEIFDRLHIREGNHYIVEDAVQTDPIKNTNQSDFHIEELENDEPILELSPELKEAFQNKPLSITEKLIQSEKDKICKALVVWKPNNLTKLLNSQVFSNDIDEEEEYKVKIEMPSDDEVEDEMISESESGVQIEPYEPYESYEWNDDQLME